MSRYLVIVAGPEKGRSFELSDGQTMVLGRGQASDTQINDPRMSRVHCRVSVDGDRLTVADAGSSGGTFVDGEKIEQRDLKPGDIFQLGETKVRYQLDANLDSATIVEPAAAAAPKEKPVARLSELVGQTFAHYRLDSIIAKGNAGMLFKGFDTEKNRLAAIKVLTPDFARSEEQQQRFVRAMKTMLPIRHPNIVELYNAGKSGPYCWAAMEYVDGESLIAVIERIGIEGMLDWREVWRVAVHIGRALREANEHKIIHRNLTPANLLRRHKDRVCLLGDLMLAKALEGTLAQQVTQPGQLIGDVPYMSPERTRDQANVDGRSDLYGLGATCYALLTGQPPFQADTLPDLVRKIRDEEPQPPNKFQMSINDNFQDVVLRLIAKHPDERYATAADMLHELERIGRFNNLEADYSEWSG